MAITRPPDERQVVLYRLSIRRRTHRWSGWNEAAQVPDFEIAVDSADFRSLVGPSRARADADTVADGSVGSRERLAKDLTAVSEDLKAAVTTLPSPLYAQL